MTKTKSSIDQLIEEIGLNDYESADDPSKKVIVLDHEELEFLIEKYKTLHRKEIKEAYRSGLNQGLTDMENCKTAHDYFNQTFEQ